jgi:uncharacterized protein (DUF433 family)
VNRIVLDAEAIPQNEKGIAGFGLLQDDLGRCGGRTVVTDNRIRSCKILAF